MAYDPFNHYWTVATNPTQRWAGARGIYVATSDATYIAWDAIDGNNATNIGTEAELWGVLATVASSISRPPFLSAGGSFPITLTNPLPWMVNFGGAGGDAILPQANLPTSMVLGKVHRFYNGGSADVVLKMFGGVSTLSTIPAGKVADVMLTANIGTDGSWALPLYPPTAVVP